MVHVRALVHLAWNGPYLKDTGSLNQIPNPFGVHVTIVFKVVTEVFDYQKIKKKFKVAEFKSKLE